MTNVIYFVQWNINIIFRGEERKCIMLWYDTQEEFMKDQITMFNKKQ